MEPSVKPTRLLAILASVSAFLIGFSFWYQAGLFPFGKGQLRFTALDEAFSGNAEKYVDVNEVTKHVQTIDSNATQLEHQEVTQELKQLQAETEIALCYDSTRQHPLASFYDALMACEETGQPVRIAHFGDSEIEGDRITDYLRHRLQLRFGGHGPGMILPVDVSNSRISVQQTESPNWQKYSIFGNNLRLKSKAYGVSGSAYIPLNQWAYNPERETSESDTLAKLSKPYKGDSYLLFRPSKLSFQGTRKFTNARLFYAYQGSTPLWLRLKTDSKVDSNELSRGELQQVKTAFSSTPDFVKYSFYGEEKPIVYGVSLEGDSGVIIDNFPMRGSSGTEFVKFNAANWESFMRLLGTRLIILTYGINVVPYASDSLKIAYYENQFYKQLKWLKAQNSERSIVVMGVGDISMKQGTEMVSYPWIGAVRDAQYRAAKRAGCAFWDMYEAMGGENAMVAWVKANPPLAAKDFTHFSPAGAHIIAEMFYKSLMKDYLLYRQNKKSSP